MKYTTISKIYYPGIPYLEFLRKLYKAKLKPLISGKRLLALESKSSFMFMLHQDVSGRDTTTGRMTKNSIFQFWTKEYLDGLVKHLKPYKQELILEVGAGNGELSSELKKRGLNIIATDTDKWKLNTNNHEVKKLSYKQALRRFKPSVVIASWMVLGEDWTPAFRATRSVREYILIGEGGYGACGTEKAFKKYKGWRISEREDFDVFNLCRSDTLDLAASFGGKDPSFLSMPYHSHTFTAKRI